MGIGYYSHQLNIGGIKMINKQSYSDSTVFFNINCPQCNSIAKGYDDITGNIETIECPICGYRQISDKRDNSVTTFYGYGAIRIEYVNRPFINVFFEEELTDKEINQYLDMLNDIYVVKESSYFYIYKDNEIKVLFGVQPQSFDKYVEQHIEEIEYANLLASYRSMSEESDFEDF
jgi:Zn ribbon nucleic-acid-binding protein